MLDNILGSFVHPVSSSKELKVILIIDHGLVTSSLFHPQRNWKVVVTMFLLLRILVSSSKELKVSWWDSEIFWTCPCFILKGIESAMHAWSPRRTYLIRFILKGIESGGENGGKPQTPNSKFHPQRNWKPFICFIIKTSGR